MMSATMLFAASCTNEIELLNEGGKTATVSFKVETPEIVSRAYSDGLKATKLQYAVYTAEGEILSELTKTDATINGSTTVSLNLASGKDYSVIFWAAATDAPYTVDFDNKEMTVDYTAAKSNDENRDAFYAYQEFTVNGANTQTIQLKRPFAQLNIGTNDYAAAATAGFNPAYSKVTVENVYKTLNLATGDVSGDNVVTFDYAEIPTGEGFPITGYDYLAMNYLLVGADADDKYVVDVTFSYTEDENGAKEETRTVGSVPVQRNYRTNIYGKLLTGQTDINVEIKPGYDSSDDILSVTGVKDVTALKDAIKKGAENIDANGANLGNLNYGLNTTLVPAGKTVTISNAIFEGRSYGNAVNGTVIFENCTFKNTGAYSIHFDAGNAEALKAAIVNGGNIELANDITVDKWIMFSEDYSIGDGTIITIDEINVTIDGKGHTLTINAIESAGNGDQLFQGASELNISNLTIKYADGLTTGGLGLVSGVIENVHFVGGGAAVASAAIFPGNGEIKVEGCTFDTNGAAIYFEEERDNLTVTNCTFDLKDNKNVILPYGDVTFTNNIINSGRTVNIVSGSPVVTGNDFNDVRLKVYAAATATVSNNTINNLEFETSTCASIFTNNTLSAAAQQALDAVRQ